MYLYLYTATPCIPLHTPYIIMFNYVCYCDLTDHVTYWTYLHTKRLHLKNVNIKPIRILINTSYDANTHTGFVLTPNRSATGLRVCESPKYVPKLIRSDLDI